MGTAMIVAIPTMSALPTTEPAAASEDRLGAQAPPNWQKNAVFYEKSDIEALRTPKSPPLLAEIADQVLIDSRELLHKTWSEIDETKEDLAKVVWKGMDPDRIRHADRVILPGVGAFADRLRCHRLIE